MSHNIYEEFKRETGLIVDDQTLLMTGATAAVGESEAGRFDCSLLDKLQGFCRLNARFHIATLTSDSDDAESTECERQARAQHLDWEAISDDKRDDFREREEIYATAIDNQIRVVNRLNYFLANGDSNPELYLEMIAD